MKTIPVKELDQSLKQVCDVLEEGGLVCLPCNASYRILADLNNTAAVERLLQSKHRTGTAPTLVFVRDAAMLSLVAAEVHPLAERLASRMWPGPLTILFDASPSLPPKVLRLLCKAKGKIGVRVPDDELVRAVVSRFARPVLVSSANREHKSGASSPAQVRKTFVGRVDLFVDAGDLPPKPASTVVDVVDGQVIVTRPGAVSAEALAQMSA